MTTTVLVLTVGALLTITTGLWLMQALEPFGPSVGSVIVFRPDMAATERWSVSAALVAPATSGVPEDADARRCRLSPGLMTDHGGSLLIEARRKSRPPVFRVHWAGGHTDASVADCGTAADLVLTRTDLMRLANAAGGFRDGFRLIGP